MKKNAMRFLAGALITTVLVGCSDDDDNTPSTNPGDEGNVTNPDDGNNPGDNGGDDGQDTSQVQQALVDASTATAYYNLDTNEVVTADGTWHIAFNRYNVELADNVVAAIGDAQEEFYDDEEKPIESYFINASTADELNSLMAVTSVAEDAYVENSIGYAIDSSNGSWYNYDPATHAYDVNADTYWIVRSAEGNSYAKMHAANYENGIVTFEFFVQADGEDAFSDTPVTMAVSARPTGEEQCFDFDAGTNVDCTTDTWDVKEANTVLSLNGGVSGSGAAAAYAMNAEDTYTNGSDIHAAAYIQDKAGSIFTQYVWQEYQVTGDASDHNLYPNYRVYVIDTDKDDADNEPVKLQITSYYHPDTGASANINFRYAPLSVSGE